MGVKLSRILRAVFETARYEITIDTRAITMMGDAAVVEYDYTILESSMQRLGLLPERWRDLDH